MTDPISYAAQARAPYYGTTWLPAPVNGTIVEVVFAVFEVTEAFINLAR